MPLALLLSRERPAWVMLRRKYTLSPAREKASRPISTFFGGTCKWHPECGACRAQRARRLVIQAQHVITTLG
eukprot:CAMPEP_0184382936 /NCGR_PEP_ID=MMETSP0007-20130409/6737_1 /TAXON_ID=97485 /ORGANISM="Prymnesium parvum, Strain Texoma1" /LENGTH=71 /DNA_ID=CAMNT_0026729187 /DNA_START=128 /DNA_END=340 /DNA_ORIENTATION=+